MLKILDRYILKKFLTSYVFVVMVLVSVICIIDMTEKNDKYLQNKLPMMEILAYYGDFALYMGNFITPLMVFITTVFVTSKLASHTEIIAILSSGVSFKRFMRPYFVGATLLAVVSFFANAYLIPNSNKSRLEFERAYLERQFYFDDQHVHIKLSPESYLYLKSYNNSSNTGYRVTLETIEGNELKSKLTARRMKWNREKESWTLYNWQQREINGMEEIVTKGNELDSAFNLLPKYFENQEKEYEALTLPELDMAIADLQSRGSETWKEYEIEKFVRYTSPFAILILTFIGITVSARKARGGTGVQVAIGFVLAFVYIIFFMFGRTLAEKGTLTPIIAVWIPNIVFGCIGVYLYRTVPK
ncbi:MULTISPECIES: LptF/LptG family permease [Persicobacter]|uniref:Membrane protein n=1 Tax=Persicobacter diffluens TaxID=981 RepID=A0AAN5AID3_9BACT|nr:LptF/LptG family permease [Persicobacter sp. CCB-QB2]GJM59784.1 membrane protein [Persicobacter diffluens]